MCVIASKRTQVDHDDGSWQVKWACRWVQHEYFHEGYHRFNKLNENRVLFYYFQSSDYLAPGTPQPLLLCRPTQLCHVLTLHTDSTGSLCSVFSSKTVLPRIIRLTVTAVEPCKIFHYAIVLEVQASQNVSRVSAVVCVPIRSRLCRSGPCLPY